MYIYDYLKKYNFPIDEKHPFNDVDQLILCQMTMTSFEMLNQENFYPKDLLELDNFSEAFNNMLTPDEQSRFYKKYIFSDRFRNLRITHFQCFQDNANSLQFSAQSYAIGDDAIFIAFRGTDTTIAGWKEDLNISIMKEVPAQKLARLYVDYIIETEKKKVYIGGHSKGANLAVYAALNTKYQDKIIAVYDNDGPGFKDDIQNDKEYLNIKDRINKVVPRSSIVGLLMHNVTNYRIIESNAKKLYQHDPFSWKIKNNTFVNALGIDVNNKISRDFILYVLDKSSETDRKKIFDALDSMFQATDINVLNEVKTKWLSNSIKILKSGALRGDNRKIVIDSFNAFFPAYKEISKDSSRKYSRCFFCNTKLDVQYNDDIIYYTCSKCHRVYIELNPDVAKQATEITLPKLID